MNLLLGVLVSMLAAGTAFYLWWDRRRLSLEKRVLTARLERLERDFGALCVASVKVGERVLGHGRDIRKVMQWQSQTELRVPATDTLRHAVSLAERGASAEDLVSTCGLAPGEAELVQRFRQQAETH